MKKKAKKRIITLISLILFLSACIIIGVLLKGANDKREKEASEDNTNTIVAFNAENSIITSFSFTRDEESLSFVYENDKWLWSEDRDFPLDQEDLSEMASAVSFIEASLMVKDPSDDLSAYGLDSPALKVEAVFSDKSQKTFLFGDTSTYNNCQYFTVEGSGEIYMLETTVSTAFGVDLDSLYAAETYQLFKDSVYQSKVKSFTLTGLNGEEITVNDEKGIEALYDLIYSLDLSERADYYADADEMLESYGIGDTGRKIKVSYTVEVTVTDDNGSPKKSEITKEYTSLIGSKFENVAEDGKESKECYYYTHSGSTVVYSRDSETIESIFEYVGLFSH